MNFFRKSLFLIIINGAFLIGTTSAIGQNTQVAANGGEPQRPAAVDGARPTAGTAYRVPALDLSRVGVQTAQPLPLSLSEAIRKALEANNTIEISRADVRFQQTHVQSLTGIYDPVFTATPNFTRSSTTG